MKFLFHLLEFVLGASAIIAWVTLLGVLFSPIAPKRILKKSISLTDCIAMGGIGLFSTFLTLFFLFLAPKLGLAKIEFANIFGNLIGGGETNLLSKWGGRILVVTFGVLASFFYGAVYFAKLKGGALKKGLLLALTYFAFFTVALFPVLALLPATQSANFVVPTVLGLIRGSAREVVTFLLGAVVFGLLVSGIYNQWDEVKSETKGVIA